DRAYDPQPPATGLCYYTPVTGWGESWTVGHGVALSRATDPSDLRATRTGGLGSTPSVIRVMLRWQWAPEAIATLVAARQGAPPSGPSDPRATTAIVTRAEYDGHDGYTLSLPAVPPRSVGDNSAPTEVGPWHIRVYSVVDRDGVRSLSPGIEPT